MTFFEKLETVIFVLWLDNPEGSKVIPRPSYFAFFEPLTATKLSK